MQSIRCLHIIGKTGGMAAKGCHLTFVFEVTPLPSTQKSRNRICHWYHTHTLQTGTKTLEHGVHLLPTLTSAGAPLPTGTSGKPSTFQALYYQVDLIE